MRRLLIITFLVLIIFASTASATVTGYRYYIRVDIHNTDTVTHNTRIAFEIDAQELVDEGYIQADGDDIQLSNDDIVPTALSGTEAMWYIDYVTLAPGQQLAKNVWFGSPTAVNDQLWIGGEYDNTQAWDDNSLDVDASTGIQLSCDFYIEDAPVSGSPVHSLMSKEGCYELVVTGTPGLQFRVWDAGSSPGSTEVELDPDDTCLSDNILGVSCFGGGGARYFDLDISTISSIPDGATLTDLDTEVVGQTTGVGGYITVEIRDSDITDSWTQIFYENFSGGWALKDDNFPARDSGGDWTIHDFRGRFDELKVSVPNPLQIAELRIEFTYNTIPGTIYSVGTPIAENTQYTIVASYAGSDLLLSLNGGTPTTSAGSFGNIHTNTDYLKIGEFNGKIDDCVIATGTPTYSTEVLNLTFEPDLISSGTISDTSASNNHVNWLMPGMDTDIDVTLSKVVPYALSVYPGATGTGASTGVPIPWFTGTPNQLYPLPDDTNLWDGIPGTGFINPWLDDLDIPRSAFWLSLFCGMLLGATFFMFHRTRDVVGVAGVVIAIFIFQASTNMGVGIIDIFMIAMFYVALYARREIGVGRL